MITLILGAGVSGFGATKLLRTKNKRVRISEGSILSTERIKKFTELGAEVLHGGHQLSHLEGVKEIIISPGISFTHPLLLEANARGIAINSELDLALAGYSGTIYAVTGTNGKSTTCKMIDHLLQKSGIKSAIAGNYGMPPSEMLADAGELPPHLVLELSSYQLEQSSHIRPNVSIFTSFSHDHLARHGSMLGYLRAKWRVFDNMQDASLLVIPADILLLAEESGLCLETDTKELITDRSFLASLAPTSIAEQHNRLNAGFALTAVAHTLGRDVRSLAEGLKDFIGLRHRCELIGTVRGNQCINDSKSTNVESTLVALSSQTRPVLLLMGGQGKGESYTPILKLKDKISSVITFGASGPAIANDLSRELLVHEFPTLTVALGQIAGIISNKPTPILFSPGCASFDEFNNYEHRGDVFREQMKGLLDG
ncbi:MAG: UDP-N-acetylmuramoyl-L-alanine--D-glutamate ligase [Deltaproteobacteria bacterium]|nr:UDP-N-acetylmuramoyl-L-alanine--D-glutamate ligase [Deltaproteobacteria bacterium]